MNIPVDSLKAIVVKSSPDRYLTPPRALSQTPILKSQWSRIKKDEKKKKSQWSNHWSCTPVPLFRRPSGVRGGRKGGSGGLSSVPSLHIYTLHPVAPKICNPKIYLHPPKQTPGLSVLLLDLLATTLRRARDSWEQVPSVSHTHLWCDKQRADRLCLSETKNFSASLMF